jgi:glycosyltransferase involved in cell wall biosynthesis
MRILVVCQHYYPEPFRLPDICETLVSKGHSVTVVTGTPNYPEGVIYEGYEKGKRVDEVINGVRVHRCPLIPRKTGVLFRVLNYYSFVLSSQWYLRRCKEDFDVVFVNQLSPVMMAQAGLSWAKRHGKKCVLYCLDQWPESLLAGGIRKDSAVYNLFLKVSRKIYSSADEILVTSRGFTSYFENVLKVKNKTIGYLPQYAEGMFEELPQTQQKQQVDFVFAGNVGALQSVETIVEAAQQLKDQDAVAQLIMQMSDYHYSDCTAEELAELAAWAGDNASIPIREFPGESVQGEQYMEFHADDEGIQQLVLDVFYEPC